MCECVLTLCPWAYTMSDSERHVKTLLHTCCVMYRISEELLPTPAKSYYTFNLRDLSKQFQGILMATPSTCNSKDALARLWLHEACRVFADRLICQEDRQQLQKMLVSLSVSMHACRRVFPGRGPCWHTPYARLGSTWTVAGVCNMTSTHTHAHAAVLQVELANKHNLSSLSYVDAFEERNIAWASFLKPGTDRDQRRYEEVGDWGKVHKLLKDYLDDYNSSHTNTMDLVFFQAAVDHVCRLCRVLQQVCFWNGMFVSCCCHQGSLACLHNLRRAGLRCIEA